MSLIERLSGFSRVVMLTLAVAALATPCLAQQAPAPAENEPKT